MKDNEAKLRDELQQTKSVAHMHHFYDNPDAHESSWIPAYIKEVQELLDSGLFYANRKRTMAKTRSCTTWSKPQLHG